MAEALKTGNPFLDAWFAAIAPAVPPAAAAPAPSTVASAPGAAGFEGWAQAMAGLSGSWSEMAQRSFGTMAAMGKLANVGDPLGDALEQSFGVMGDVGPAAAHVPAAMAEATAVASRLVAAREAYRLFMVATWQRAFEEITREALARASGGTPPTPSQWLSLSNTVADRVFVETFNSPEYLEAQRRLSDALADQRRSEMKLVELTAQFGHYPTRRALDEVGAEVSDLRRRVRRLERASREAADAR